MNVLDNQNIVNFARLALTEGINVMEKRFIYLHHSNSQIKNHSVWMMYEHDDFTRLKIMTGFG